MDVTNRSLRGEYDKWHNRNQNLDPAHDDASSPWYAWVQQSLGDVCGLCVLEVACGRGGFIRRLSSAGARTYGLDFSFAAVRLAKQKAFEADPVLPACLTQGDAHALPFPPNFFDVVVSCETIEHLPAPLKALSEFYRVTRPGGRLFLTTPNYLNLMGLYEIYAKFRHPDRVPDQPFDRLQVFFQTRALLRHAGWRIIRSDGTVHQILLPGHNPIRVEGIETNSYIRRLLSPFAYHYCLVAGKTDE
jgi:ubiquinone/menaquinone biosynthesis C-methylase UbiE